MQYHRNSWLAVLAMLAFAPNLSAKIIWGWNGNLVTVNIISDEGFSLRSIQLAGPTPLSVVPQIDLCNFVRLPLDRSLNPSNNEKQIQAQKWAFSFAMLWADHHKTGPLIIYDDTERKFIGCCALVPSPTGEAGTAEIYTMLTPATSADETVAILEIIKNEYAPSVAQHRYQFNDAPLQKIELWLTASKRFEGTHPLKEVVNLGFVSNTDYKHPHEPTAQRLIAPVLPITQTAVVNSAPIFDTLSAPEQPGLTRRHSY